MAENRHSERVCQTCFEEFASHEDLRSHVRIYQVHKPTLRQ